MEFSTVLNDLSEVIANRKANPDGETSYVASLLTKGLDKISAKVLEEASEAVEAAQAPEEAGREHLTREVADLVFHALVLLGYRDLRWESVEIELRRRFGIGGHQEKASRAKIQPDDAAAEIQAGSKSESEPTPKAAAAANVPGAPEGDSAESRDEPKAFLSVFVPGDDNDAEGRAGAHDIHTDPVNLIYVETQWIRYEALNVLELMDLDRDDKNLSGSLLLKWPDPKLSGVCPLDPSKTIKKLQNIFEIIRRVTPAQSARTQTDDGEFIGLLAYSSGHQASSALLELRDRLRQIGMGVREVIHDLLAPREA